jgi:hypothetical protein
LKKDFSRLPQLGVIGYDQWQVTANGGTAVLPGGTLVPAKFLPYYSVHAVGGQATFIMPTKNLALWFKYEHKVRSVLAHSRNHDRVRRLLDSTHPEASAGKTIGESTLCLRVQQSLTR